jgi:GNAT superfamily N-acetyltransferase
VSADRRWLALNLAAMSDFFARAAINAPDGRLIERDGLIATVNPGTPKKSLFNGVIYEDPAAVERELADLATIFDDSGVLAWTVWVPHGDGDIALLLEEAGHRLDASPRMMGLELADVDLDEHSMDGIEWTAEGASADVSRINDLSYGITPGTFAAGCGEMDPEQFRLYVADHGGEPASAVVTHDVGEDLGIWAVATLPEARGQGLSTALMRQALADARERGLATSTLQASALGRPVYLKVGYGDYGHFEMWERRREE